MRLPVDFVKHRRERLGQALVVALVFLLGGGTAAALRQLPSDVSGAAERGGSQSRRADLVAALSSAGTAPSRVAVGRLVARRPKPRRAGPAYYRRTTSRHVPASAKSGFMPLYREAARTFGVSWRLIASIHRQETAFSTEPSTYHGLNAFGCCAGPMQFNVKNGPVSTWELYRQSFRLGDRPRRYPHRTRSHPSIYDDFDAIMAAGALLRDSGASEALDGGSWSAAYAYYGHDLFGIDYASQVMGRARGWERDGFCLNCPLDETLVAAFDDAYGVDARRQLRAAERRHEQEKRKKRKKDDRAEASRKASEKTKRRKAPRRSSPEGARRAPQTETTSNPGPSTTTPPSATTPEPPTSPPQQEDSCTPVSRLLGCGR